MREKLTLIILIAFAFLMTTSYTMLIPFLPVYLSRECHTLESELSLWSGLCFSITFLVSAFVSPLWGKLSDRFGKKPMIIRSSMLLCVSYFSGALVHSPEGMFLMRAFQGIASGLWPACLVMLSASIPKSRLGVSMGLMQSANILGGIMGPLIGGLMATAIGMRNSFFLGAFFLLLICLCSIFILKEPPQDKITKEKKEIISSRQLLSNKGLIALLGCVMFTNLVILQIQPVMPLYVQKLMGNEGNFVLLSGVVMSVGGLAGAIASPIWGKCGQRYGFLRVIVLAFLFAGVTMCIQGLVSSLMPFILMQFVCGIGFFGIFPCANSLLVRITPSKAHGTAFGLLSSSQMLGGGLGPLLSALVVNFGNYSLVYVIGGIILFSLGLYLKLLPPKALLEQNY